MSKRITSILLMVVLLSVSCLALGASQSTVSGESAQQLFSTGLTKLPSKRRPSPPLRADVIAAAEAATEAAVPTEEPTSVPTEEPTSVPTEEPTAVPTEEPTAVPTEEPTAVPTEEPTAVPTEEPTAVPTEEPTAVPTEEPTAVPTEEPTAVPTGEPTAVPTEEPTAVPTEEPTAVPTEEPTAVPTEEPTAVPTEEPTAVPTEEPTAVPTEEPTAVPTEEPTAVPTEEPTAVPTEEPTLRPTMIPTPEIVITPEPAPTEEPLMEGAISDDVKAVQDALTVSGFFTAKIDGIYGPKTATAIKLAQQYAHDFLGYQPVEDILPEMPAETVDTGSDSETPATVAPAPTAPAYEPDGVCDAELKALLLNGEFPAYVSELSQGDKGAEVERLQRRLTGLNYMYSSIDGIFGSRTKNAVEGFQAHNELESTGTADQSTQEKLYSADAVPTTTPKPTERPVSSSGTTVNSSRSYDDYKIVVDVSEQRLYVYGYADGGYNDLVRSMDCSTGTKSDPTPIGTFTSTGPANRWHYFKKFDCWAQYSYYIDGPYMLHSVLFSEKDEDTLMNSSVRNLGKRASHGCIRVSVKNARWIYKNCDSGTPFKIKK